MGTFEAAEETEERQVRAIYGVLFVALFVLFLVPFVAMPQQREVQGPPSFQVAELRGDPPEMGRKYTKKVEGYRVEIELKSRSYAGRYEYVHGFIYQSNERYVMFACDRVADEVLVPGLAPKVEAFVREVFATDRRWITQATSFTDSSGTRWQKVSQ